MQIEVLLPLALLFVATAAASASLFWLVLSRSAPARRRLQAIQSTTPAGVAMKLPQLTEETRPWAERLRTIVPKSPAELGRLRKRLMTAGYRSVEAAVLYSLAEKGLPLLAVLFTLLGFGIHDRSGWVVAAFAAVLAFFIPGLFLERQIALRKKQIRNGLPDALDLLIVCLEAGSAIDQAILKVSEELHIAYPALAEELALVLTETRAGKPRLEAFKNFAARTKVDEVRALVAMLVQTDRFGTSLGQALRAHAETARVTRRQKAEERAAKLGVKLVIPLVFFLFPALYVVVLGPMVIRFVRIFMVQFGGGGPAVP